MGSLLATSCHPFLPTSISPSHLSPRRNATVYLLPWEHFTSPCFESTSQEPRSWLAFLPFKALTRLDARAALVLYGSLLLGWCSLLPFSWLSWRQSLVKGLSTKKGMGWLPELFPYSLPSSVLLLSDEYNLDWEFLAKIV